MSRQASSAPIAAEGRRTKIVLVSHSREIGGAEVYLENLAHHLAIESSARWRPELVCRRDHDVAAWAAAMAQTVPVERLDVLRPQDALRLARDLRTADMVQLNLSYPAGKYPFAAALLAAGAGRPLVVTHHLALRVGPPWRQLMRWLGGAARRHIAVSQHSASVLVLDYGYPRDRIEVIHNGIDPIRFHPATPEARALWRRTMGERLTGSPWREDVKVACTVARLNRQKGLFDLLEAAARLDKSEDVRILVIGEGELRRSLAEKIGELGLGSRVYLVGAIPRSEVGASMAASDLFVLPSRYEGGPATALMEAMACGCAVVASDVSGTNELITDSDVGWLVGAQDPEALAGAMSSLLADPGLRTNLAQRGRAKVLADFTIAASMQKTEAVFEAALRPTGSVVGASRQSRH